MPKPHSSTGPAPVPTSGIVPPVAPTDPLEPFRKSEFTEPVADLEKLLSQSRRVFLMGAGCSKCAGLPLMPELTDIVLKKLEAKPDAHAVLQGVQCNFENAAGCNIEDYMSELVDLVCIADRRERRAAKNPKVPLGSHSYSADDLLQALAEIKDAIAEAISQTDVKIDVHRQFVRTIHGTLQSGKSGTSQQVDYFTLNYDTLLEDALALERTPLADGFNGGVTGWWDAGAYATFPAHARIFKVHGSIDWCLCDNDVLPRRIRHGLGVDGQRERVLIWPASTKYRETQRDPYAQIIGFMRQALRPQSGGEVVLTICGYAFGDAHINIEIDRRCTNRRSGSRSLFSRATMNRPAKSRNGLKTRLFPNRYGYTRTADSSTPQPAIVRRPIAMVAF